MSRTFALGVTLATLLIAPVASAATPADDPFYGVPDGIDGLANGSIIDSRGVTATQFSFPIDAHASQVFLAARFAGTPAITTCTVGPDPAPAPAAARRCTSRRVIVVHVRAPRRGRIVAAKATVAGRRVTVRRDGRRHTVRVDLVGRSAGAVRVSIAVRTSTGARYVDTRTYRPCTRRR